MRKYRNANLFKKVLDGTKGGGCVSMVKQVHHQGKTLTLNFNLSYVYQSMHDCMKM